MTAIIVLRKEEFEVRHGMSIRSALKKLDIPLEAVLPTRKGELVHEETLIKEGEMILLVPVISGG